MNNEQIVEQVLGQASKREALFRAICIDDGKPSCFQCGLWGWVDNCGKLHWECSVDEMEEVCRKEFEAWMAEKVDEKQKAEEIRRNNSIR